MIHNFVLFLSISGGEIILIVLVVYLVFGPKKIPELARMLGKGMNELRRATDDIRKEITKETGNIKKEMDIGIDLKDPLDLKKNKDSKPSTAKNDEDGSASVKKETEKESESKAQDKPSEENQEPNSPKGSVPRS